MGVSEVRQRMGMTEAIRCMQMLQNGDLLLNDCRRQAQGLLGDVRHALPDPDRQGLYAGNGPYGHVGQAVAVHRLLHHLPHDIR